MKGIQNSKTQNANCQVNMCTGTIRCISVSGHFGSTRVMCTIARRTSHFHFAFCISHCALFLTTNPHARHVLDLPFRDMARSNLEDRGEAPSSDLRPWAVHHPRPHGAAPPAVRAPAAFELAPRDLVRQPDDDAVFQEAGSEAAPDVYGRQTEHPPRTGASVLLDELREKVLEI
jgi:hypothetical protein